MSQTILERIKLQNLSGAGKGLPSYCTAHPFVLETILRDAARTQAPVLVEATCNQVNQEGGYTGQRPAAFVASVRTLAKEVGLEPDQLLLGGDHLGPNPWRKLPASQALERAHVLVGDYVRAGFGKIHLDASMPLGGDPRRLDSQSIAARAADLCRTAERATSDRKPYYVIGTEVPVPGGETDGMGAIRVTAVPDLLDTVDAHRREFTKLGIEDAFERVIAVVAQPGVDFDQKAVLPFEATATQSLAAGLTTLGLLGEAHSTDYQSEEALTGLVSAHFAILKVGPELTFAYSSAVLALAALEDEVCRPADRSNVRQVILDRMAAVPEHWRGYYDGDPAELRRQQLFSFSDRIRYYWPDVAVGEALRRLLSNLERTPPADPLWRQAFPELVRPPRSAAEAVAGRVARVTARYRAASGLS